uniref:Transmembrane protein 186 n=1 Tax=Panagrolaimus sp. ES5 TaxID=591445 RepID=A0AC34F246_9BILA
MVLTQIFGVGYLAAEVIGRRAPTAAASSTARLLSTSQTRNSDAVENARERLQKRYLSKKAVEKKVDPFGYGQIRQRIGGYSIRKMSTAQNAPVEKSKQSIEEEQKELAEILKDEKWVPIYRFPGIAFSSFISKLKFFQTLGSALVIPWATYNYASGYQTFEFLATVYAAAILAPITLFAFSRSFNRMIGVMAMNEKNEYIRIGYLSFFGTRKNAIIPIDDIMPLSDVVSTMEKYPKILQLKRFSNPNHWFYVPGRGCQIVDKERAKLVFGTLAGFLEMPDRFLPKQVDAAKDEYLNADEKLKKAEANYEKTKKDLINKYKNE